MSDEPEKFPDDVIVALHSANVTVSCVPVQIDNDQWQAAVFFVLAPDAPCISGGNGTQGNRTRGNRTQGNGSQGNANSLVGPFAVELDADLHEHANGTLIEIGIEIATPVEPSRGTLLFLTGHSSEQFETLTLLSTQSELPVFIGDQYCTVLSRQKVPLNSAIRSGIKQLLDEAVSRDAVIRMTGRYDPETVFKDVVAALQLT